MNLDRGSNPSRATYSSRACAVRSVYASACGLLLLVLLAATAAAGCARNSPPPPVPPAASEADAEAAQPAFTFGIIYPIAHPFYEAVTERAEQAAAAAGGRLVVKAPDEANLEQQIRMLENMIRQRVDGIAVSPIDSEALTPYIDQAAAAGIPVICFESDAPASGRLAYIGGDNERAGRRMGEALEQLLPDGGMVLAESGVSGSNGHRERLEGFMDYVRDNTDIQVLEVGRHEGSDERALAELERMIDEHPHFDAFVALDYISGSSSVLAWKAMGLNRYALTFGVMPSIEEAIANGQITLAVSQNEVVWGERIVATLRDALRGDAVPEWIDSGEAIVD